jgi:hypothetical protein
VSAYLRSCTFEAEALRAQVKEVLAELRTATTLRKRCPSRAGQRFAVSRFEWLVRLLASRASWPARGAGLIRAVSIQVLTFEDHARGHFLEKNATRLPAPGISGIRSPADSEPPDGREPRRAARAGARAGPHRLRPRRPRLPALSQLTWCEQEQVTSSPPGRSIFRARRFSSL